MNTIRDAYQPPTPTTAFSKFWMRFYLVVLLLLIAFGLMIYTGVHIQRQLKVNHYESRRYPVDLNPNPIADGSGQEN